MSQSSVILKVSSSKGLLMVTHCRMEFRPESRKISEGRANLEQHLGHTQLYSVK